MHFRRKIHKIPLLNTTATADISFMLLIFFLVTSSMSADKGLQRQLPPHQEEQQPPTEIDNSHLLSLTINADNTLTLNRQPTDFTQLRQSIIEFVEQQEDDYIISVETADESDYETYFQLQSTLAQAYALLYDKQAQKLFHKPYQRCTLEEQLTIKQRVPYRVADAHLAQKGEQQP